MQRGGLCLGVGLVTHSVGANITRSMMLYGPWRADLSAEQRSFKLGLWAAAATATLGARHPLTRALCPAAAGDGDALAEAWRLQDDLAALPRRRLLALVSNIPDLAGPSR
jgi:hypothetical protein